MKEIELIESIKSNLRCIFAPISFIQIGSIQTERTEHGLTVDLIAELLINKKKKVRLLFEVKSEGQPRYARIAAMELKSIINQKKDAYGVLVAPFISDESKQICKENHIGFMDLAGNYLFSFDSVYLSKEGQGNPYVSNRPVKSIFSTKATRILRVLLCSPKIEWYVQDLAKEADISLGHASNIKEQLLDLEWLEEKHMGKKIKYVLKNPSALLQKWSENYSYTRNKSRNFYALDDIATTEKNVIEYFQRNRDNYAFSFTSGASRVAPFLRYNRIYFYLQGDLEQMIQELGWKEVDTGPNITILEPYDAGIFYQTQEINRAKIVSNIQLYLDLQTLESRGKEAAQYLLEQKLSKEW